MSGRKRILVDESEWYRLRRQAGQLSDLKARLPKLVDAVREQTNADLERVFATMEDRHRIVEQNVRNFGEQTRAIEHETQRRLHEHAERTAQALREAKGETRAILAQQESTLRAEIAEVRRQGQEELGRLTHDREQSAAAARTWLDDARAMRGLVAGLPHERHRPGALAPLERRLSTAADDVDAGRSEAALSLAQSIFHDLSDLRVDVELRERDRQLARTTTIQALVVVTRAIDENAVRPVRDDSGEVIHGVTLDVDHWSGGQLSTLRTALSALTDRVRADDVDIAELHEIAERRAPELADRLVRLVERAGERQLRSQIRVNLADIIAQTLDDQAGYEFVDSAYEGEDQRAAFYAKLRHQNGNEIVVDLSDAGDDIEGTLIRVHSFDRDTQSEVERMSRMRAITQQLRAQGINSGEPQGEAAEPDSQVLDIDAVRTRTPVRTTPAAGTSPSRSAGTAGP